MALSCPFQSPQYRRICLQPKLRISCSTTIRSEVRQLAFWPCSTPSILSSWNSIISSPLKIKKFWLFLKKPVILMKKSFFFNSVSCSLAFESDLSKSNSITWLDYKLHFPYWVFLWAVQKRLLTTHQEKYKKYNLKVQKREKDFTKSNIYNFSQPVYCHRKEWNCFFHCLKVNWTNFEDLWWLDLKSPLFLLFFSTLITSFSILLIFNMLQHQKNFNNLLHVRKSYR